LKTARANRTRDSGATRKLKILMPTKLTERAVLSDSFGQVGLISLQHRAYTGVIAAAHRYLLAIRQQDGELALCLRTYLFHELQVHTGRAVHTQNLPRIDLFFRGGLGH